MGLRMVFVLLLLVVVPSVRAYGPAQRPDPRMLVALRTIGHHMLLIDGDTTSRVLPVQVDSLGYSVRLATDLAFDADSLVQIVARAMAQTGSADNYLVEVRQCATGVVVYSYAVGPKVSPDEVPCQTRPQPEDCYVFSVIPGSNGYLSDLLSDQTQVGTGETEKTHATDYMPLLLAFGSLGGIGLFFWLRNVRKPTTELSHAIAIGQFRFDERSMTLTHGTTREELTGKEAELLMALFRAANTTLERDVLLKEVWGDAGDYVGRTLDVFISKLRKKLEADPNLRIINVRGIGYRLVVDAGMTTDIQVR